MHDKFIFMTPPPLLLPCQNNEFWKVTPLILSTEGQNNESFLITLQVREGGGEGVQS